MKKDRLKNRLNKEGLEWKEYLRIYNRISKFYHVEYKEAINKTKEYEY